MISALFENVTVLLVVALVIAVYVALFGLVVSACIFVQAFYMGVAQ